MQQTVTQTFAIQRITWCKVFVCLLLEIVVDSFLIVTSSHNNMVLTCTLFFLVMRLHETIDNLLEMFNSYHPNIK